MTSSSLNVSRSNEYVSKDDPIRGLVYKQHTINFDPKHLKALGKNLVDFDNLAKNGFKLINDILAQWWNPYLKM